MFMYLSICRYTIFSTGQWVVWLENKILTIDTVGFLLSFQYFIPCAFVTQISYEILKAILKDVCHSTYQIHFCPQRNLASEARDFE